MQLVELKFVEDSGLMVSSGYLDLGQLLCVYTYPCGCHIPLTCPLKTTPTLHLCCPPVLTPCPNGQLIRAQTSSPSGFLILNHQVLVIPAYVLPGLDEHLHASSFYNLVSEALPGNWTRRVPLRSQY